LHVGEHALDEHVFALVPALVAQTVPHAPQLVALLVVLVSQPFAALLSQSPVPAPHVAHAPAVQVWLVVQTEVGQVVPQLASVVVALSQPFGRLLSQLR
jgi:hypothetical protein